MNWIFLNYLCRAKEEQVAKDNFSEPALSLQDESPILVIQTLLPTSYFQGLGDEIKDGKFSNLEEGSTSKQGFAVKKKTNTRDDNSSSQQDESSLGADSSQSFKQATGNEREMKANVPRRKQGK